MKKLNYSQTINAPRETVWKVLWEDETYRQWTKPFSEESHATSDWKEGSRVEFLDGKNCGMYSEIERLIPNEYLSFKHLGSIKDGEDVPFEGDFKDWAGSHENYTLKDVEGATELLVDMDSVDEFVGFMDEKMPLALSKVKELSESL